MEKKVYDLQINETLAHVMPQLQEMELMLLTKSLITEGCRDPLVVWDRTIIDGHNRYRICRENSIPFGYVEMSFQDEAAARRWIIRNQLARRNVPDYVRCEMVLPLEEELKAEAKKRQGQRNDLKSIFPPTLAESNEQRDSRDLLATIAGVSHGTLGKAKKISAEADEETKNKLRSGEISINKAFTALKSRDPNTLPKKPAGNPGDIIPGVGVEQIMGLRPDDLNIRQPDEVYDIQPIEVFGNMPADDPVLRGRAELIHTKSDLQTSTDYYARRVGEILRGMSAASTTEENIELLKSIVTTGYDQIINLLNQKLIGGSTNV